MLNCYKFKIITERKWKTVVVNEKKVTIKINALYGQTMNSDTTNIIYGSVDSIGTSTNGCCYMYETWNGKKNGIDHLKRVHISLERILFIVMLGSYCSAACYEQHH